MLVAGVAPPLVSLLGRVLCSVAFDRLGVPSSNSLFRRHEVTYVIAFPCVDIKDKSCIEECPVDCIYEGDRMLYIQPDECVDCGACEPVCPVEAIFYEDDVPEEWSDYTAANAEFFADLGSPGGASKLGGQAFDAALLANVPRKEEG